MNLPNKLKMALIKPTGNRFAPNVQAIQWLEKWVSSGAVRNHLSSLRKQEPDMPLLYTLE